jgi:hypothetical protein
MRVADEPTQAEHEHAKPKPPPLLQAVLHRSSLHEFQPGGFQSDTLVRLVDEIDETQHVISQVILVTGGQTDAMDERALAILAKWSERAGSR